MTRKETHRNISVVEEAEAMLARLDRMVTNLEHLTEMKHPPENTPLVAGVLPSGEIVISHSGGDMYETLRCNHAPDDWDALIIIAEAAATPSDGKTRDCVFGYGITRDGSERSMIRIGEEIKKADWGLSPTLGKLPDYSRRYLGLSTAPSEVGTCLFYVISWLHKIVDELQGWDPARGDEMMWGDAMRLLLVDRTALRRRWDDNTAEFAEPEEVVTEMESSCVGWERFRQAVAGARGMPKNLEKAVVSPLEAKWMDEGMFSRVLTEKMQKHAMDALTEIVEHERINPVCMAKIAALAKEAAER